MLHNNELEEKSLLELQQIEKIKQQFLDQFKNNSNLPSVESVNTSTLLISKFTKYNVKKIVSSEITSTAIRQMLDNHQEIRGLPKSIADFLDVKPSQHREILALKPELITWTEDKKYLLMPNPQQTNHELLMQNPKKAKYENSGFGLIAWFIHPFLLGNSKYSDRAKIIEKACFKNESLRYGQCGTQEKVKSMYRVNSFSEWIERNQDRLSIKEIVKQSGVKYIAHPFDYTKEDLDSLQSLKILINHHLMDVYGVTVDDKVDMYFHTIYAPEYVTAHLHVRINQLHHGIELNKTIFLDDLINCLEKGKDIKHLFMEHGMLYFNLDPDLIKNMGFFTKKTDNPFLINIKKENEKVTYSFV